MTVAVEYTVLRHRTPPRDAMIFTPIGHGNIRWTMIRVERQWSSTVILNTAQASIEYAEALNNGWVPVCAVDLDDIDSFFEAVESGRLAREDES